MSIPVTMNRAKSRGDFKTREEAQAQLKLNKQALIRIVGEGTFYLGTPNGSEVFLLQNGLGAFAQAAKPDTYNTGEFTVSGSGIFSAGSSTITGSIAVTVVSGDPIELGYSDGVGGYVPYANNVVTTSVVLDCGTGVEVLIQYDGDTTFVIGEVK